MKHQLFRSSFHYAKMSIAKAPGDKQICFVHKPWRHKGIFFGEKPLTFATPVLLLQLSLCALLNGTLQYLLTPLGESAFISQILAGAILGPSFLGRNHIFRDVVFPIQSFYVCDTFANFGLMLFLFLVGVKMDLSLIRKCGRRSVVIGLCTFFMPLLLNFALGKILTHSVPLEPKLYRSLFWVASFQSLSSFHVIVCVLADLKLLNSDLGRLALSSSMISGSCSWFWTIFVFTGKQAVRAKRPDTQLLLIISIVVFTLFILVILRPVLLWMARTTVNEKSISESYISVIFIMILVCALFGEIFGQHFLFGPMILGMSVPDGPPLGSALIRKLECFISTILLPMYFVVGVSSVDLTNIDLRNFGVIELLAFFASVWKLIGAMLPSLYCKMPPTDALCLGLIMGTQGITDVLVLQRAMKLELLDKESYSIMVLSIVLFAVITSPIVKFLYKPFKRYTPYKRRTIQHTRPNSELRILACIYHQDHTPCVLNLLQASYPHPQSPICCYALHLIELADRAAPTLVAHYPGTRATELYESEHIVRALRLYENQNHGIVTMFPYSCVSPNATMHDDVCTLALEKRVSMVIVPFHKLWSINVSMEEANAIRAVNQKILRRAPCSVGVLIDRGTLSSHAPILPSTTLCNIGVIFLGGKDDREALAYASRMAKQPNVNLTVVRFLKPKANNNKLSGDVRQDFDMLNQLKQHNFKNPRFVYQEESVKDSVGMINVIRKVENFFDLILVGRHQDKNSSLLVGLSEWNELPEFGFLGDMLASSDSTCKVSVLVVEQHSFSGDGAVVFHKSSSSPSRSFVDNSSAVVDIPWGTVKVCPVDDPFLK